MAQVVFIRAGNVGGNNVFRPAELVKALAHLDVVNVGAAGTFVIRARCSVATIRKELAAALPFTSAVCIRPGAEITALVESAPFERVKTSKDLRGWVSVLAGKPKSAPKLPIARPAGDAWSVRFERVQGAFALGIWRRAPKGFVSPHAVVEAALGVPATTRYWETIEKIGAILAR